MSDNRQCPYSHLHGSRDGSLGVGDDKKLTSPRELTRRESEERFREAKEIRISEPLYYGDYLQVPKLLSCQTLKSREHGVDAHDEHLFVIIHQTYELWFKQILHELRSVTGIFKQSKIAECHIFKAVSRLRRVVEIQRVLVSQLTILETMTPLGFLEFRDFLFPASGFQSVQWRMIENLLGLQRNQRVQYGHRQYCSYLNEQDAKIVKNVEEEPSMHDLVESWLERTPYLNSKDFNFWDHYRKAVEDMLEKDRQSIKKNKKISEEKKKLQLGEIEVASKHFISLFDKDAHDEMKRKGHRRLSQKAMQAALFITLYQDEPILHMPFQLLNTLLEIDECMTLWRYRHSLMVHRMIGARIGTGGSSGFHYLKSTATRHRIFKDFFNLSTFLIPRVTMPELPESVKSALDFVHED
jgi:tryptophan 2,3-dioxygenase